MAALVVLSFLLLAAGCITRTHRETVFEKDRTKVFVRYQTKGGSPVERGFDHPAAIAPVRVAHILSRIDLRMEVKKGSDRVPAIPLEALYTIAEGISKALAKADPDQEVVVMSIRRHKHWGLFDRSYLTSFLTYMQNDQLFIHLSRHEWEIPKRRESRLPEPHLGEQVMKFRIIRSVGMTLDGEQSVMVAWRDDIFRKATRTRITPGGKVVRRTVLMEIPQEDTSVIAPAPKMTDALAPETLRALADLEDERRGGGISEARYNVRRLEILRADPASLAP